MHSDEGRGTRNPHSLEPSAHRSMERLALMTDAAAAPGSAATIHDLPARRRSMGRNRGRGKPAGTSASPISRSPAQVSSGAVQAVVESHTMQIPPSRSVAHFISALQHQLKETQDRLEDTMRTRVSCAAEIEHLIPVDERNALRGAERRNMHEMEVQQLEQRFRVLMDSVTEFQLVAQKERETAEKERDSAAASRAAEQAAIAEAAKERDAVAAARADLHEAVNRIEAHVRERMLVECRKAKEEIEAINAAMRAGINNLRAENAAMCAKIDNLRADTATLARDVKELQDRQIETDCLAAIAELAQPLLASLIKATGLSRAELYFAARRRVPKRSAAWQSDLRDRIRAALPQMVPWQYKEIMHVLEMVENRHVEFHPGTARTIETLKKLEFPAPGVLRTFTRDAWERLLTTCGADMEEVVDAPFE